MIYHWFIFYRLWISFKLNQPKCVSHNLKKKSHTLSLLQRWVSGKKPLNSVWTIAYIADTFYSGGRQTHDRETPFIAHFPGSRWSTLFLFCANKAVLFHDVLSDESRFSLLSQHCFWMHKHPKYIYKCASNVPKCTHFVPHYCICS